MPNQVKKKNQMKGMLHATGNWQTSILPTSTKRKESKEDMLFIFNEKQFSWIHQQ
jgi:hypothetical protein